MPKAKKKINTLSQAMRDAKTLTQLVERNASMSLAEALKPSIRKALNEGLREGEDEEVPPEEPPVEEPAPAEEEEPVEEAGDEGGKATIDLDKLSQEMENEMRREADLDLDIDDEDEEAPVEESDDKEKEEPKKDDEEMEEVQVTQEEIEEAYRTVVKEFDTPSKDGEPEDVNSGPAGISTSQKPKDDSPWNEEEPPDAEDFTVKEAWYKDRLAGAVRLVAERDAMIKKLAGVIKEQKLDQAKLYFVTKLFNEHKSADKSTKEQIVDHFDAAKTVREAKRVYDTAQSILRNSGKKTVKESRQVRRKSGTSSVSAGRAPQKPLTEADKAVARYKKLALIND